MTTSDENAIHEDAFEQNGNESAELDNAAEQINPRMEAMEAIAAGRRKSLEADGVTIEPDNEPAAAPVIEAEPEDEQLAAQMGEDDRHAVSEQMVKVKVDGEEMEIPLSEVTKSYQKDAAATRRLQEANRILEAARSHAVAVEQQQQSANLEAPVNDENDRLGKIKEALSKLYEGDDDGAAQGLLALLDKGAPATQPVQLIDSASLAAEVKQQLAFESAYEQAQSDYPELFADTERGVVLGRETYGRMQAKVQSGMSRAQALRQSTEEVAALFGVSKPGRQSTSTDSTARDEKLARKAKLDNPGAANVVAGSSISLNEAPNVSATIAEMARGRLGQSMNLR